VIPVLPLYAEHYGASEAQVGLLLAVYSAMQFLFAPVLGQLSDRFGRRPVLLVSILGAAFGFVVMGFARSLPMLFVARLLAGITGANISTAQAYIADVTPPEQRSRGMGMIGAAFGLGFIFGPALGGVLSHISLGAPFFFAAALAACNATAVYFLLPESLPRERRGRGERRRPLWQVAREPDSALARLLPTYFLSILAFAALTATYPLFANHRHGFDAVHTGYVFAWLGVVGAVLQGGLIGRLAARFGDRRLALVGLLVFAASLALLPLAVSVAGLVLASTLVAIGNGLVTPTLNALASRSARPEAQGHVLGAMASAGSLGRVFGPVLGGWLLGRDALGPEVFYGRSPYWAAAVVTLLAFAVATRARPERAPAR